MILLCSRKRNIREFGTPLSQPLCSNLRNHQRRELAAVGGKRGAASSGASLWHGMALSKKPSSLFAKLDPVSPGTGCRLKPAEEIAGHKSRAYLEGDQWLRIAVDARQLGGLARATRYLDGGQSSLGCGLCSQSRSCSRPRAPGWGIERRRMWRQ